MKLEEGGRLVRRDWADKVQRVAGEAMAEVSKASIKQLHDEIAGLLRQPGPTGPLARERWEAEKKRFREVVAAEIPRDCLGAPLAAGDRTWTDLDPNARAALHRGLTELRDEIRRFARPVPLDPTSFMYEGLAENWIIWTLLGYSLVMFLVLGAAATWLWPTATRPVSGQATEATSSELRRSAEKLMQAVRYAQQRRSEAVELRDKASEQPDSAAPQSDAEPTAEQRALSAEEDADAAEIQMRLVAAMTGRTLTERSGPPESIVLWSVILLGALGGTLRLIGSLVRYVGNRQLTKSWALYYLAMPVQGALLAAIVYMLLRVGILAPSVAGESGTAHLNLISIYAFAALTGLFANQAMVKLRDVFEEVFRPKQREGKDPLDAHSHAETVLREEVGRQPHDGGQP